MRKYFFYILFIFIFNPLTVNFANSQILKKIDVNGNDRLSDETIILFSELNINENIDSIKINDTFKKIFSTNYVKDLNITFENGILTINVIENSIIQTIEIVGIKNKSLLSELKKITKKFEKYPYIESNIIEQKNLINNIVKRQGYYFSNVIVKQVNNSNNTIDITYEINLGKRAEISTINFSGNKIFRDSKLKNIIISEETKPWKFITKNIYIDIDRILLDEKLLTNYFKNNGYYNAIVKSSFAKVVDKNYFNLNFNINLGEKFFFNELDLNISDDYRSENFIKITKALNKLKGKRYSLNKIEKIIKEIDKIALQREFVFINAKYEEQIVDKNKLNLILFFEEDQKSYVEKINIFGNFITEEKVIRNSLIVDEGDAYNKILFNKSINNIKSRNIFKSVKSEILDSELNKENKIINISVEEKPTGQIFAGVGTGTSGSSITAGIKEDNFVGKGIKLDTNLTLTEDEIKGQFSVINPNFRNSDRLLKTTLESTTSDFMTVSGYKLSRTGISVGTNFEQYEDLFVNLELSNYYENLKTSSTASAIKKSQEGDYFENLFRYGLNINKLNQNFQPSDGFYLSFLQTLPIYSDDNSIENSFSGSKYHSINENLIISAKFLIKSVNSLDDNVRVSKRIYIPGSRLRGFESGAIGPKEGNQYIGGNYGSAISLNSTIPNLLTNFENIDFNLFLDAANLWHVDYNSSLDSNKIRSATGLSVNWFTPIGPLSFSYATPLSKANSDKTETFRFQIGTSF